MLCIAALTSSEVTPSALRPLSRQALGGKLSSLLALQEYMFIFSDVGVNTTSFTNICIFYL